MNSTGPRKNFYAIKNGDHKGIYDSWMDCKSIVMENDGRTFKKGFCFKGFVKKEEAVAWMAEGKSKSPTGVKPVHIHAPTISERILNVYTDGSDRAGRLGIGAFCSYDNIEYFYGDICNLKKYNITESCSNPTAEFIAVVEVINMFRDIKMPLIEEIHIWTDYDGVPKWISGENNCNEPHIKKIKSVYDAIAKSIQPKIRSRWVKGHVNIYGNEQADKCAGGKLEKINTFPKLIQHLQDSYQVDKDGYSKFNI